MEFDVTRDDGQQIRFPVIAGVITALPGIELRLQRTADGWTLTDGADSVETYDANGRLLSIKSRGGVVQTVVYDASSRLSTVSDNFGYLLTFGYDTKNRLTSVTDPAGRAVQYGYDIPGRLVSVTNADSTSRTYVYENYSFPYALTGVLDENASRYSTWGYDASSRGSSTQEAGGANAVTLVYNADGTVRTTDALGAVRTFTYTRVGDRNLASGVSGSQCPTCSIGNVATYDSAGFINSRTDYNGNVTQYVNGDPRGLETSRTEAFGTPLARTITTSWDPTFRLPKLITEPNRTAEFTYDGSGNALTKTLTDTATSTTRVWTYTYNSFGQVLTADGPRTDVVDKTTYTYYSCSTAYQCGQLNTISNALGQVTTFNTYNVYGQPLTITDPNGVVTMLTYDARQRLTSTQVGTETTGYSYWPIGLLKTVTLRDGSTISYTYDGAHRLTNIADSAGNYINYTLNALGNRTADNIYDPTSTLRRTHTRVFNTLNQLYQDINAAGTAAVTTTLGYDAQGNLSSSDAPLSRNTSNQYDPLNRIDQLTDPKSGIIKLGYDANDNLASVIDPRNFTTSYTHNGFKDVTQLVSPDTGASTKTYDSGGNLRTVTDARGAVGTFSYDALNRLTLAAYTDQTISFGYDAGAYGKGRLTGASDANHSMSWAYDAQGRVTSKGQTIGTVSKSVGYGYTNGDLTSLVTPSGKTVSYTYANHRISSIAVNGTTLLSNVTYDPFGPVTGWTWGNGTTVTRAYDEDGNPQQIVTAGVTNGYTVDEASRITGISDSGQTSGTFTFGYDQLDRVTSGHSSSKSRGYTYDANGNRLTTTGTTASSETVATTSNRLSATSGGISRTYSYDAAGNTLGYANNTYTFNQRGRMSSATVSAGTTNYIYNALGEMIEKSGNGGTTLLMYDEAGHLLGEYSSTGTLIEETVWLGDTPVATLRVNGTGFNTYYVHTDHLNTPRKITRPSDNAQLWRWDPDTFGSVAPAGSIVYNLRFPGHYALNETGLFYNYFRTYDPQTGRYLESDPIGLRGGINTYSYAGSNPISFRDPTGLAVYVGQHGAFFSGDPLQHSAIVLVPDNPADFAAFALFQATNGQLATLGGQPSGFNGDGIDLFGTLVGSVNNPGDSPCNLHDTTRVPTPNGMSDTQFIQQLLGEFASYGNNLAYDPFPASFNQTYNSNGFVSGLLIGAGATPPNLPGIRPGYGNPIPVR